MQGGRIDLTMSSYRVTWLNDKKTVIVLTYESGWSWEDVYRCSMQARAMMLTVPHGVYGVVHFLNSTHVPPNPVESIGRVAGDYAPNTLGIVVAASNPVLLDIIDVATHSDKPPIHYVESWEAALQLLREAGVDTD